MDIYTFLILTHLIGTILGVGGATMIEVHINKALSDGQMSPDEKYMMASTYGVVRVGLILAILSGFGFLILYKMTGQTFRLYDPILWAKMTIVMAIAGNALLLQSKKISLYWGSALSFVSWWVAAILGIFSSNGIHYSFLSIMSVYVLSVVCIAVVLHWFRKLATKTS